MANNVWSSPGSTDGNLGSNWSLGHVPTIGEDAYYDGTSSVDCIFTGSISCDGVNVTGAYGGNVDFGDGFSHAWGSSGAVFDHAGNVDMGTGTTHTITNGIHDNKDVGGTLNMADAIIIFSGSCTFGHKWSAGVPYETQITASSTLSSLFGSSGNGLNNVTLGDGATLSSNAGISQYVYFMSGYLILGDNSRLTGIGSFECVDTAATTITRGNNVTIDPKAFYFRYTQTPPSGIYDCDIVWQIFSGIRTLTFNTGLVTINGDFAIRFYSGTGMTLDLATNNTSMVVQGDLIFDIDVVDDIVISASSNALTVHGDIVNQLTGGGSLVANSQDLTLSGTSNQNIDLCDATWGLITINKAGDVGSVTFSGNMDATGIDVDAAANVDFGDSRSHAWGSAGMVFDHTGNVDLGTGTTHTVTGGDYDVQNVGGTITISTSTVVMSGNGGAIKGQSGFGCVNNLTISAGATITQPNSFRADGDVDIAGSLSQSAVTFRAYNDGAFIFRSTANISGTGTLEIQLNTLNAGGVTTFEAGATVAPALFLVTTPRDGCPVAAGNYQCPFKIQAGSNGGTRSTIIGAGAFTVESLELEATGHRHDNRRLDDRHRLDGRDCARCFVQCPHAPGPPGRRDHWSGDVHGGLPKPHVIGHGQPRYRPVRRYLGPCHRQQSWRRWFCHVLR
jgi:hypothetical protein